MRAISRELLGSWRRAPLGAKLGVLAALSLVFTLLVMRLAGHMASAGTPYAHLAGWLLTCWVWLMNAVAIAWCVRQDFCGTCGAVRIPNADTCHRCGTRFAASEQQAH